MSASTELPQYSEKARQIIQRTNELLAAGGYNGFSYADIAESVEVKKPTIHHHFPTKADLVKATVVVHRDNLRRGLASLDVMNPDPLERLVTYCRIWADCIQSANPPICICAMLAAELPSVPPEVAEEVRGHFQELQAWVAANMEQGVAQGRMKLASSPMVEASIFVASIHGAMLTARATGEASVFWEIARQATDRIRVP